jgi:hypothetical protein
MYEYKVCCEDGVIVTGITEKPDELMAMIINNPITVINTDKFKAILILERIIAVTIEKIK